MMRETQAIRVVLATDLLHEVKRFSDRGARMIQIGCTQDGHVFELNYSFDVDGVFENIRVCTNGNETICSVSNVYLCAFIYENEIHDLYGISFEGIAVDYKGTLFQTAKLHPFRMEPNAMKGKAKAKGAAKPATKAATKPSDEEKQTEQSVDQPTDQPIEQPIDQTPAQEIESSLEEIKKEAE